MAKKAKAQDEIEAAVAAAVPKAKKMRQPASLFKAGMLFAGAAIGLLLVLQVVVGFFLFQAGTTAREQQSALLLKHYLSVVNTQIDQYALAADGLAADPAPLLAVLAGGSTTALEQQLTHATPGAVEVRVVPAVLDPAVPTTLTYAQQDMVGRVAQTGKGLPPEQALLHDTKVVALARPLKSGGTVQGVVIVSFPLRPLGNALAEFASQGGKLELGQGFDKDKTTVVTVVGADVDTAGPLQAHATHDPNWELRFAPAVGLGRDALALPVQAALLLASVLAVAVLYVLGLRVLGKRLDDDIEQLDSFSENFIRYGDRRRPTLHLSNFAELLQHLELYVAEMRAGKGAVRSKDGNEPGIVALQVGDDDAEMLLGPLAASFNAPEPAAPTKGTVPGMPALPTAAAGSKLPAEIFRAYDIRGKAGVTLTGDIVRQLGLAIGSEATARAQQVVIVGRDCRLSSPDLYKQLIEGLQRSGRDVIDIGMVPTPVLYFAANTLASHTAVMLTGSHNPPEDNGLKIMIAGRTLVAEDIEALRQRIETQNFTSGSGGYSQQNVSADYVERVAADVVLARSLRVVLDAGNGVAGPIGIRVLEALGCTVIPLYCDPDGRFPNHQPDPAQPKNMEDLQSSVVINDAHLGIALDGDGDRIGVVTGSGTVINADRLMMLFAKHVLVTNPGADIIFDVKCSRDLINVISSNGGRPVMSRTGHSYLKAKLAETGAPLAGEMSGHIVFNDRWFGFDDALYAAARVLEILSLESDDADAVFDEFPESLSTPELSIPVPEAGKQALMERISQRADFKDGNINRLDGIRVDFADGWGLVRASNTTASLVMRFEGRDEAVLKRIQGEFKSLLLTVEPGLDLPF